MRPWYQKGRIIEIRAGQQTRFWHDCWCWVECPLKIRFHNLFRISTNQEIEVAKAFEQGQFRRQINDSL
jgi:hypothetical protein